MHFNINLEKKKQSIKVYTKNPRHSVFVSHQSNKCFRVNNTRINAWEREETTNIYIPFNKNFFKIHVIGDLVYVNYKFSRIQFWDV